MMNFEENLNKQVAEKISVARNNPASFKERKESHNLESGAIHGFIKGEYDISGLKQLLENTPDKEGVAYFDNLSEFIAAVRQVVKDQKIQDEILDHENAHASEAEQRGYKIRYAMEFARDQKNFIILKFIRSGMNAAGVDFDFFNKNNQEPSDVELREDLIAIISAPETLTNGTMSASDKSSIEK